jgi:Flp pilus assembly protein TadG
MMGVIKNFIGNKDGNYAVMLSLAALPILGSVGIAVDYSNLSRLNYSLSDAVDSMCSVVAREYMDGKDAETVKAAGKKFFETNIDADYTTTATATFTLPDDEGNTAKTLGCKGVLHYKPLFGPTMALLSGGNAADYVVVLNEATMKMKNVAEIALVLDNSGSMAWNKAGNTTSDNTKRRITLMKAAAKKLITDMIVLGAKIQQTADPVKFAVIPFSSAVNVGANNANATWMDTRGVSPIHHEHLNWGAPSPTNPTGYRTTAADGAKLDAAGNPLTRFSILNALQVRTGGTVETSSCEVWAAGATQAGTNNSSCRVFQRTGTTAVDINSAAASAATSTSVANLTTKYRWTGCVEARPNGMDVTDADASGAGAFVPFFVPDELNVSQYGSSSIVSGRNNWWPDYETDESFRLTNSWSWDDTGQMDSDQTNATDTTWQANSARPREVDVAKYFVNKPYTSGSGGSTTYNRTAQHNFFMNNNEPGPNDGCNTKPITPLTGTESTLHNAIDAMAASGNTNIPEGVAWGWRTISSKEPFSQGVSESRKDIDKVVIVLTDGANTYSGYGAGNGGDMAGNKTYNTAFGRTGYAGNDGPGGTATASSETNVARLFAGTDADETTHDSSNFQTAMDDKMKAICTNIKNEEVILMFVALDMDPLNYDADERPAIQAAISNMTTCSGESKTKRNPDGSKKKLFWNATSDNLEATFKEIADELSNLRFTQ